MMYATFFQGWCICSLVFARISFCLFMLCILGHYETVKWFLWFLIGTQFLINACTVIIIYAQCGTHIQALWDSSVPANCLHPSIQRDYSYFQSGKMAIRPFSLFFQLTVCGLELVHGSRINCASDDHAQSCKYEAVEKGVRGCSPQFERGVSGMSCSRLRVSAKAA